MRIVPSILMAIVAFAFAATSVLGEHSTPTAAASGQSVLSNAHPSGPDAWRYRWCNGRWWYWLPENRWTYWEHGRWVDYDRSVQPGTPAQSTFVGSASMGSATSYSGYQPHSSAYQSYEGSVTPRSSSRGDYGLGWGWGNGWNGQGYSWRSNR